MPIAINHNQDGSPEMWNNEIITPLMFEMIKDTHSETMSAKDRVTVLEKKTEDELLKMASCMGIINFEDVRKQIMMKKKAEILEKHGSSMWYSESENCWYCHIPDATKKGGRRKVKRKKKEDIENILYEYWMEAEKQNSPSDTDVIEKTSEPQPGDGINTISDLFYEFMEYKSNQVTSGTIKRMKADWEKFYVPYEDFIQKPFRGLTKIDLDNFFNEILTPKRLIRETKKL